MVLIALILSVIAIAIPIVRLYLQRKNDFTHVKHRQAISAAFSGLGPDAGPAYTLSIEKLMLRIAAQECCLSEDGKNKRAVALEEFKRRIRRAEVNFLQQETD